jgi:hypothetical protein
VASASPRQASRTILQGKKKVKKGVRNEWHFLSRKLLEERKLGTKMAHIAIAI